MENVLKFTQISHDAKARWQRPCEKLSVFCLGFWPKNSLHQRLQTVHISLKGKEIFTECAEIQISKRTSSLLSLTAVKMYEMSNHDTCRLDSCQNKVA